ncbi:MAG TPA: hypothetical protein VHN80_19540 [Kineosporiaceae bacterium]|nr:hypothetical protein [Kineosporiaceae bacterium]
MVARLVSPLITLLLAAIGAALATAAAPPASGSTAGPSVDRVIRDPRIDEASGLTPSLDHAGVLWTHNDSDNPSLLFAIRTDGSTAAAVRLKGVTNRDWEAVAGYRDPTGRSMLAVGDIGDNAAVRSRIQVVILPEPALRDAVLRPTRTLTLRYPSGPSNAETLLIDPVARRMYVVTKGLGSTVFEVPPDVWPGLEAGPDKDAGTLIRVAVVPMLLVTDGVVAPNGHVLLRTYSELAVLPPIDSGMVDGSLQPLVTVGLPNEPQGEGIGLVGTSAVLLASEGLDQRVLRVALPRQITDLLGSPRAGAGAAVAGSTSGSASGRTPGSAPGSAAGSIAGSRPASEPAPQGLSRAAVTLLTAVVGAAVLAAVGVVIARTRRR